MRSALATRRVVLRPVGSGDLPFLYSLATDPEIAPRWRFHGVIPSAEAFRDNLATDVAAQFVVVGRQSGRLLGHVALDGYSERDQVGFCGAALAPPYVGSGLGAEAALCMFLYCFQAYPLRKLYLEVPEFNLPAIESSIGRLTDVEGRLKAHLYYDGRRWDMFLLAVYRSRMDRYRRLVDR